MNNVENLRRQIENVSGIVSSYSRSGAPSTLAEELSVSSFRQHLEDLRAQLGTELALRSKEIVEVGLSEQSDREPGTVPLHTLAKLANNFGQAVQQAARYRKHGTVGGPAPNDVVEAMNLRLAGLSAAASTHLYITANTGSDLFGHSLVEESLKETFAVLRATSAEALVDAVAVVGYSAATAIKRLLRGISKEGLTLEINWRSPEDKKLTWRAAPDEMRALAASLEAFEKSGPEERSVVGKVITVSLRDPFVIETDEGEIYSASVAADVMPLVQETTVGSRASVSMIRNRIRNKATGREKVTYTLIRVATL
jgi:hypothetical protein